MFQSMLESRFKLKAHRETREMPAYRLVVEKNEPKRPRAAEGAHEIADAAGHRPRREAWQN